MRALDDDLMMDQAFRRLLVLFSRQTLTWEGFLNQPLPPGMSATATWELLHALGRDMGVPVPIPDLDGNEYWYRRPYHLTDTANAVGCACRTGSRLQRIMNSAESRHFLLSLRIGEMIASARLDGLEISAADARAMVRCTRQPKTPIERLVFNIVGLSNRVDDYLGRRFSIELFREFAAILLEGVDADALPRTRPPLGIIALEYDDERIRGTEERQMTYIAAYANHEAGDDFDLPVLRALLLPDVFQLYRPVGKVSTQVGRLVGQLYALKHDLPVLSLLPISQAKLDFETGRIAAPDVCMDLEEYKVLVVRAPGDATPHHALEAELAMLTLRAVEREATAWERRDREIREILRREPLLNQRQRSILHRAMRSPDAEFRIRYHQRNHSIAYTTARRDLLELADKGYLKQELRGKAFVFVPAPALNRVVGGGHPSE